MTNNPPGTVLAFLLNSNDTVEYEAVIEWCGDFDEEPSVRCFLHPDMHTWPQKINWGVRLREADGQMDADWYLCAADDIQFTPNWWDETESLRQDPTVGVIGTRDSRDGTGNPRVAAGDHTCHALIRGHYIRSLGTVDEPGKAVHDGYHHWYVDDELVWTAKLRGAWAMSDAVIHHDHPYWNPEIPWDTTYAKGEEKQREDMALWLQRGRDLLGLEMHG